MLNIVRRSQVRGLMALDGSTPSHLGEVDEVWVDETRKVVYLSAHAGYFPLGQVADVSNQALSTYGRLVVDAPENLQSLDQLAVHSAQGNPLGWVEDFLFDWHTGDIVAYLLAGQIAESLGESTVLYPDDVAALTVEQIILQEGAEEHLQSESEGLNGFLSEKSQPVRHLVKMMGDRLHHLITPQDKPEIVRVKIKQVSEELATSGEHDHHALQAATTYLHEQWESLQHSISRAEERTKAAFDTAWKHLMAKQGGEIKSYKLKMSTSEDFPFLIL